jgi:hypothetical protein
MSQPKSRPTVTVDRDELVRSFAFGGDLPQHLDQVIDRLLAVAKDELQVQGFDMRVAPAGARQEVRRSRHIKGSTEQDGGVVRGSGLGQIVSLDEGRQRLAQLAKPIPLESWAGPVRGPTEAADYLGLSRATLDNWRKAGMIIALPKGLHQHLIPMEQFFEGRPLSGLGHVLAAADGSAMVAWHWLRTPHVDFTGAPPLLALRAGHIDEVRAAAERSLG